MNLPQDDTKMVLATGNDKLMVDELKNNIQIIQSTLRAQGITDEDKVIVYISDHKYLLSVLWVLMEAHVVVIPIEPIEKEGAAECIADQSDVKYIITEKRYADTHQWSNALIIDLSENQKSATSYEAEAGESLTSFVFFDAEDKYQSGRNVSADSLQDFFQKLDHELELSKEEIILLSLEISYHRFILEMIWAASRNISIVIDSPDGNSYTFQGNQLAMDFGLFHFGSYLESSTDKYDQLFSTVKFADQNDFSSVWTPERHFNEFGGLFPNPSVLSAAIAAVTTKVQIRSGSLVSPLHHPVRIAEDWSLVDNISNGRVAISFASGWQCDDFIFCPEKYAERHDYMMEQIEIVRSLWKGGKATFKNGLDKEVEVSIFPKPVQEELPVWITVSGKTETFVDAGKIGANILTHLLWQDTDELIDKIAAYRASLKENGYEPKSRKVTIMVHTYLGADNETVKNKVRQPLKEYIRTSTKLIEAMAKSNVEKADAKEVAGRYGSVSDDLAPELMEELVEIAFNRFFDQAGLLGTVDKAKELIHKLKGYDIDEVAALIDFGLSKEEIMNGLEYLNELRREFDINTFTKYETSIAHCSQDMLNKAKVDVVMSEFFKHQKTVLIESDNLEDIPDFLQHNAKIIYDTSSESFAVQIDKRDISTHAESLFSTVVSEEF